MQEPASPGRGYSNHSTEMESALFLLGVVLNQHAQKLENALNKSANAIIDRMNTLIDINIQTQRTLQSLVSSQLLQFTNVPFSPLTTKIFPDPPPQAIPTANSPTSQQHKERSMSQCASHIQQQQPDQQNLSDDKFSSVTPEWRSNPLGFEKEYRERWIVQSQATPEGSHHLDKKRMMMKFGGYKKKLKTPRLIQTLSFQKDSEEKKRMMQELRRKIGNFFTNQTEKFYNQYSKGQITYSTMKINFSWNIMNFMIENYQQLIQRNPLILINNHIKMQLAVQTDQATRKILEYLIHKYPPVRNKILDTQLSRRIKPLDKQYDIAYDTLKNARMSFVDDTGKTDFTKEIKIWLNMIIRESQRQYPRFKAVMRGIFSDEASSIEKESDHLDFEICSKINSTTEPYTNQELELPGLSLKGPELLRILSKWADQLMTYFTHTQKLQNFKSGFKSSKQQGVVSLRKKKKDRLWRHLRDIYSKDVHQNSLDRQKQMYTLISQLLALSKLGYGGYQQLDRRQVIITKIAQFLGECGSTYTLQTLNNLISCLNGLRKKYSSECTESTVDLVRFGVMDILRAKCKGSKSQLLRVYNELISKKDYFEIVRIKNKLDGGTRDVLINLKIKESFLICEVQLSLGDASQEINNHFCHNLYEMYRSPVPVVFENANQLVNLDTRVGYFGSKNIITFKKNPELNILDAISFEPPNHLCCSKDHPKSPMQFRANIVPYCCSCCATFIASYTCSLEYMRCELCMTSICPKCIIGAYFQFSMVYLKRYTNFERMSQFVESQPLFVGFGSNSEISPQIHRGLLKSQYLIVCQFDKQSIKINIVKKYKQRIINTFFTVKQLSHNWVNDSPFNLTVIILPKKPQILLLSQLPLYHKSCMGNKRKWHQIQSLLESKNINQLIGMRDQSNKQAIFLDIVQTQQQIRTRQFEDDAVKAVTTENSKLEIYLELPSKRLKDLKVLEMVTVKSSVRSLNLWENQLVGVAELGEFPELVELNLKENQVKGFGDILKIGSLQYLDVSSNAICGVLPRINMPNLRVLDISNNKITDIRSLSSSSLPCLNYLIISQNHIKQIPMLQFSELQLFVFSFNSIQRIDGLTQSKLPRLRKINGSHNCIQGWLPLFNFQCLQQIQFSDNQLQSIQSIQKSTVTRIQLLDLSKNKLKDSLPVLRLSHLTKLQLQHNNFTDISSMSSWQIPSIRDINLSRNKIHCALPLMNFPSLQSLNLDYNHLTDISSLESCQMSNLKTLSFNNNSIQELPIVRLKSLQIYELSHNQLSNVDNLRLSKLPELTILNLSYNVICSDLPVLIMNELRELYADGNDIKRLMCLRERQLIPKLTTISLENNKSIIQENLANYQTRSAIGFWSLIKEWAEVEMKKTISFQ